MSQTSHVIHINAPYVKYRIEDNVYTFSVRMSDLIDNWLEHEYSPTERDTLFFILYNPMTQGNVVVKLKSNSLHKRVYENASDPNKIIQLIVI
jgi:hypothetical protein